ncbi:MAG TPA: hypothetical protein VGS23_05405 [Thermoplasmata archaeon]|nr:hypothetical protein [Thermoplasmata archaeon]
MAAETTKTQFREHLREIGRALGGLGKDVELDVADAPTLVKEGTKNTLARAAGIRRTPMREWSAPDPDAERSK